MDADLLQLEEITCGGALAACGVHVAALDPEFAVVMGGLLAGLIPPAVRWVGRQLKRARPWLRRRGLDITEDGSGIEATRGPAAGRELVSWRGVRDALHGASQAVAWDIGAAWMVNGQLVGVRVRAWLEGIQAAPQAVFVFGHTSDELHATPHLFDVRNVRVNDRAEPVQVVFTAPSGMVWTADSEGLTLGWGIDLNPGDADENATPDPAVEL